MGSRCERVPLGNGSDRGAKLKQIQGFEYRPFMAPRLHTDVLFRPPSSGGLPGCWIFGSAIASTGSCWPRSPWVACSGRSCICDGPEGLSCHGRPGGCWCSVCSRAPCWPSGRERPGGPGSVACWRARRRRTPPPWSAAATRRSGWTPPDPIRCTACCWVSSGPGWPRTRRFTRCTRCARLPNGRTVHLVDVESDQAGDGAPDGGEAAACCAGPGIRGRLSDPSCAQAFAGRATFDEVPRSDRAGTWVTAYLPLPGRDRPSGGGAGGGLRRGRLAEDAGAGPARSDRADRNRHRRDRGLAHHGSAGPRRGRDPRAGGRRDPGERDSLPYPGRRGAGDDVDGGSGAGHRIPQRGLARLPGRHAGGGDGGRPRRPHPCGGSLPFPRGAPGGDVGGPAVHGGLSPAAGRRGVSLDPGDRGAPGAAPTAPSPDTPGSVPTSPTSGSPRRSWPAPGTPPFARPGSRASSWRT